MAVVVNMVDILGIMLRNMDVVDKHMLSGIFFMSECVLDRLLMAFGFIF